MSRAFRSGALVCLASSGVSVEAQNNPPGCAADFADMAADITSMADDIIKNTVECAEHYIIDSTDKEVDEKKCTNAVFSTVSTFLDVVADIESGVFDCFRVNQGCGQTIASAAGLVLDVGGYLIDSTTACEPATARQDQGVKGFGCWAKVWKVVKSGVKCAKYIDVALTTCPAAAKEKLVRELPSLEPIVEPVVAPVVAPVAPVALPLLPPAAAQPGDDSAVVEPAADPASVMFLAEFPRNAAVVERRLLSQLRGKKATKPRNDSEDEAVDLHMKFNRLKSKFAKIFGKEWQPSMSDDDLVNTSNKTEALEVVRYYEAKTARPTDSTRVIDV